MPIRPEADDAGAHPRELAPELEPPRRSPQALSHESVRLRDLAATGKRQCDREIGDVVEQHGRCRDHDAPFACGREVGCFQAYAVNRAEFEIRHQFEMATREPGHPVADRAANTAPDARERCEGIGLGINGVDFETALQFFEDEGLLHADQRQFDIRKRLDVLADFRVDACPMFSFDFRLPTHSELDLPLSSDLTAISRSGQRRFGRTCSKLRHRRS